MTNSTRMRRKHNTESILETKQFTETEETALHTPIHATGNTEAKLSNLIAMQFLVNMQAKDFITFAQPFLTSAHNKNSKAELTETNITQILDIFDNAFALHYPLETEIYNILVAKDREYADKQQSLAISNVLLHVSVQNGPLSFPKEQTSLLDIGIDEIEIMKKVLKIIKFSKQNGEDPIAFAHYLFRSFV